MPQAEPVIIGGMRVISPRHGVARQAEHINVGPRIEIQESPFGDSGNIYLSASDPVDTVGYSPGDLWMNTGTGNIFRME